MLERLKVKLIVKKRVELPMSVASSHKASSLIKYTCSNS